LKGGKREKRKKRGKMLRGGEEAERGEEYTRDL